MCVWGGGAKGEKEGYYIIFGSYTIHSSLNYFTCLYFIDFLHTECPRVYRKSVFASAYSIDLRYTYKQIKYIFAVHFGKLEEGGW